MKLLPPLTLITALSILFINNTAIASDQISFGQDIYLFHKKQAENGNKLSQYKLGTMYELGLGTKLNIEEAKRWYTISSEKGYNPASDRLTYLQIRNQGFNPDNHDNWLSNLRNQAQGNDSESLFLLGQLYRHGIGVDRNPNQAILLLKKAGTMGMIEADLQVESIERQLASSKIESIVKRKTQPTPEPGQKNKPLKNTKKEKRLRYEATMRKLEQERMLLDAQQKWAESQ